MSAIAAKKVKAINLLNNIASIGIKVIFVSIALIFIAAIFSLDIYGEIAPTLTPLVIIPAGALIVTVVAGITGLVMAEGVTE